jgi:hypothetical protein
MVTTMLVLVMLVLVLPELRTFVWLPSISGWSFSLQPLILVKFSQPLVLFLCIVYLITRASLVDLQVPADLLEEAKVAAKAAKDALDEDEGMDAD